MLKLVPPVNKSFPLNHERLAYPPPGSDSSLIQRIETFTAAGLAKLLPAAFALSALVMPASAGTNLVKNGGFEANGGPGATVYNPTPMVLDDWTFSPNGRFAGIDTEAHAYTNTTQQVKFWGASPGYQNGNGFSGSPDGGYFYAADGNYAFRGNLSQDITGLKVGAKYDLTFYHAYGQEACPQCNGATRQAWHVVFGSDQYETDLVDVPSHGFVDWNTATHTFTASATTQTLTFWANGGSGAPPFALLDSVKLTAQDEPPAPPAATPGPLTLLGLGASFAWSSRLRKRINLGSKA